MTDQSRLSEERPERAEVVAQVRRVLTSTLRFPPGLDLGRSAMLDNAADEAVIAVEVALGSPWRQTCPECNGRRRLPCNCWDGCSSTYECPTCEGIGGVLHA